MSSATDIESKRSQRLPSIKERGGSTRSLSRSRKERSSKSKRQQRGNVSRKLPKDSRTSLKDRSSKDRAKSHTSVKRKKEGKSKRSTEDGSSKERSSKSRKSQKDAKAKKLSKADASSAKALSRDKRDREGYIRIFCGQDVYYVKVEQMAACSELIKREKSMNAVPKMIDLSKYDRTTAKILVDHIESREVKVSISFYSIAELLKLSSVLEMKDLHEQLEGFTLALARKDPTSLHQILLISGVTPLSAETERVIFNLAASKFRELASSITFQQIPFKIAIDLFSRCELNVQSELQVVDALLFWLAGQQNLAVYVPALFSLVRHGSISAIQKAFIIERARSLRFDEESISAITRILGNSNGLRECASADHRKSFVRCQNPSNAAAYQTQPAMPLSLPRPEIFYKPEFFPESKRERTQRSVKEAVKPAYKSSAKELKKKNKKSNASKSQKSKKEKKKQGKKPLKGTTSSTKDLSKLALSKRSVSTDNSSKSARSNKSKKESIDNSKSSKSSKSSKPIKTASLDPSATKSMKDKTRK